MARKRRARAVSTHDATEKRTPIGPATIVKALVACISTLAAFAAVWTTFLAPPGPKPAATARIVEASASPNVSLRNYLDGAPGKLAAFTSRAKAQGLEAPEIRETLATRGVIATFSLELKGDIGSTFDVRRTLYESASNARAEEAGVSVIPPPRYVLHSPEEHFVDDTWIAYPSRPKGPYLVELDILGTHESLLAEKQTRPFRP